MLPTFTIIKHDNRFYVETDWSVASKDDPRLTCILQVTTSGRLSTASAGWATAAKADAAMEQCKARLR
jgi:hypothetical protein